MIYNSITVLQWRHNERDGAPDHQPHDCLLNRAQIKEKNHEAWLYVIRVFHPTFVVDQCAIGADICN